MSERFSFPLAGSYNTRISNTNQLSSSSGIVGAGIVGIMIVGSGGSTPTKDQRFVNCFAEKVVNPYTQKATIYTVKRPGFASVLTPQAGSIGNEILVWTGNASKIISAFGATNSSIYDSATRLVTNNGDTTIITGKATGITETVIGTTATLAISSSDSTAWYYQPAGTVTKISDGDFPGNAGLTLAGTFAHMDGYAFIMDSTGAIWDSDLNSITAWTAGASVSANSYPDKGIGVIRHRDKIMAFGTESIQFFQNAGLTPSPLLRIEPMTLKVGCVGYAAITRIADTVFWAGSSAEGGLAIYGYRDSMQRISTPEIDSILIISGAGNISLSATRFYGRSFVIVQASTITFVYCVEENSWHEWTSLQGALWTRCAGVSSGGSQVTYAVSNQSTSGKVFTINPASLTFQDNGISFTATVQTSRVGEANRRTFWNEIEIVGDTEASTSNLVISAYDDDYLTPVILGTVDLSQDRPRLTRCGSSYRRSYGFSNSSNTPMRIEALTGRKSMGYG